jgi:hypothetical protein
MRYDLVKIHEALVIPKRRDSLPTQVTREHAIAATGIRTHEHGEATSSRPSTLPTQNGTIVT